jgi:hypothetical protein
MFSLVQRTCNSSEDEYNFSNTAETVDSHNLRNEQQADGIRETDGLSIQVSQRTFQQLANSKNRPHRALPQLGCCNYSNSSQFDRGECNDEISEIFALVAQLETRYNQRKEKFQEQAALQGTLLSGIEYVSVNKDNIVKGAEKFTSVSHSEVKVWLNKGDTAYKWTDDILHLIAYIRKYYLLHIIQTELQDYHQRLQKLKGKRLRSDFNKIRNVQKYIDALNRKLKIEKKETWHKGKSKVACFTLTKLTSFPLEHLTGWSSKTAVKVGKIAFNIFKNTWGIWKILNAKANQDEWLYYLQPRLMVNIYPDKPTDKLEQEKLEKLKKQHENAQEKLLAELNGFLTFLDECKTIEDVQAIFKEVGISFEIPSTFEEFQIQFRNKRFQRNLIQEYYYCVGQRVVRNDKTIKSFLNAQMNEKRRLINERLPFIAEQIIECQNKEWPEIQKHFDHLKIRFDSIQALKDPVLNDASEELSDDECAEEQLPLPPTTKLEWEQCIQNEKFCKALAKQWVDYQEAKAQSFMQAMRQFLLSKHSVEHKFLNFWLQQYVIGLISTAVQLAICIPYVTLSTLSSVLAILNKDLAKSGFPGVGAFYIFIPLYPNFNFKLEGILLHLCEHLFAIKYKPNEYSLKSYRLTMQKRMFGLAMTGHTLLLLLKQALLWLNMRLIENGMMGLEKKPISQDVRFMRMNAQYEQRRITFKQHVEELEECLKQLKIQDAKQIISPQYAKSETKFSQAKKPLKDSIQHVEESNECNSNVEEEIEKTEKRTLDPIYELVQSLEDADFECFPYNVLEAFEDNFGFQLTDKNKENLQERLESFFSESEAKFIDSFRFNRFNYLIRV